MTPPAEPSRAPRRVRLGPNSVDRYLIGLLLRPMGLALAVAMAALLTERMLRLFELMADQDAALAPVLTIALSLTPHYLGLALPAAFCIGLIAVLSELSRANELDALESAGWSLRRIGAVFVGAGVVLALLSVLLFGFAQPYARYAYRAAKHAIATAGWSGRVEEDAIFALGDGLVVSAAEVGPSGRVLARVFVLRREADGGETALTAERGYVLPDKATGRMRLRLENGVSIGPQGSLAFEVLMLEHDFGAKGNPFRARGAPRELTLGELASGEAPDGEDDRSPAEPAARAERLAEFHARLVRSVSLIGIALAAVPLGVLRKRSAVWPRAVVALGLLTAYHHVLLLAQQIGASGAVPPALALWGTCAAFMAFSVWLYAAASGQGAEAPGRRLLRWLEGLRAQPGPTDRPGEARPR